MNVLQEWEEEGTERYQAQGVEKGLLAVREGVDGGVALNRSLRDAAASAASSRQSFTDGVFGGGKQGYEVV